MTLEDRARILAEVLRSGKKIEVGNATTAIGFRGDQAEPIVSLLVNDGEVTLVLDLETCEALQSMLASAPMRVAAAKRAVELTNQGHPIPAGEVLVRPDDKLKN